jgi:hypothetical protein
MKRTVRRSILDGLFFWVHYWRFERHFRMVRPPNRGRSALHLADCLSLSLLELHFRFDLSWGLLLWKVHCDYVTLASSCGNPWL